MRTLLPTAMAFALFLTLSLNANATHPPHVTRYIETYNEIAIQEMHRSGIPASVTLAQGIHESSWGLGELSTNSNNHFGIKCKSIWKGPTYYIEDDDYQNGTLVKSCFRVYDSVEESYIDHTNFLVNGPRYKTLFNYDKTDYENWAKGLKSCGYATDPKYDSKLIKTIEKYGLNKYDYVEQPVPQIVNAPIFHIPLPQTKPQSEPMVQTPSDLVIPPSVIVVTEQPAVIANEDIPPAVNIEDYFRNANLNNNQTTTDLAEETLRVEESIEEESQQHGEILTRVLSPPSYQLTPTSSRPVQPVPEQSEKLEVVATNDNNLLLMKGTTRVKKVLRR